MKQFYQQRGLSGLETQPRTASSLSLSELTVQPQNLNRPQIRRAAQNSLEAEENLEQHHYEKLPGEARRGREIHHQNSTFFFVLNGLL